MLQIRVPYIGLNEFELAFQDLNVGVSHQSLQTVNGHACAQAGQGEIMPERVSLRRFYTCYFSSLMKQHPQPQ